MRKTEEDLELSPAELAETAMRVFANAGGILLDKPEGWSRVILRALGMMHSGEEPTALQAAGTLRFAFYEDHLPVSPQECVAWEAVSRHLANIFSTYDQGDNLAEMEQAWRPWAARRIGDYERGPV